MYKLLLLVLAILFFGIGMVHAQERTVTKFYDGVQQLAECSLAGTNRCVGNGKVTIRRFVPESGYVSVYFFDKKNTYGEGGGFDYSSVYFEPSAGGRVEVGTGLQVFERGNLVVEFEQPYTDTQRLETEYEFVFYYLPHTDTERRQFLLMLQDEDEERFSDYKKDNEQDIVPLCEGLKSEARFPAGCPESSVVSDPDAGGDGGGLSSDSSKLPELDFSGKPIRKPVVTIDVRERLVFLGEPVTVKVDEVFDPDGKCQSFQFTWEKPDRMMVKDASVDPRLGHLFFVPQSTGPYLLRFRAKEFCKGLGTLSSGVVSVRVIVNDKSKAFPDLVEAGKYQNAIYDLYHLGVMKGYSDGTMRPNDLVNRAEFLKMIFETLLYRINKEVYSPRYPDVTPADWFSPYVWQADVLSVIKGYPDGQFKPERPVNLAEALKMVMHFTTLEIEDADVYSFTDVQNTDWYSRYVQTAYREGILDDIKPGAAAKPGQYLTRGKAALIIVRTLLFPVNRLNPTDKDVLRQPEEFEDFSSFTY